MEEEQTIVLVRAQAQDAEQLADISKRAFHTDVNCGSPYGTPAWNLRTRHFYEKLGFVLVGSDGRDGVIYERVSGLSGSPGG